MKILVVATTTVGLILTSVGSARCQTPVAGSARTSVAATCPSGKVIPAGTPIPDAYLSDPESYFCGTSGPNVSPAANMNQAIANAEAGVILNLIGGLLSSNKNDAEARNRAAAAAAAAEQERQDEMARQQALAEQKRQEMFDRLSHSLKLSGLATLSLKGFDNNAGLQLKGFGDTSVAPSGNLQLKGFGNSESSNAGDSRAVTSPFGLGGNPCPSVSTTSVASDTVDLRHDPTDACPSVPTGDPNVVDLRDVQQGVDLAAVAANEQPGDRQSILDQALDAANGDHSIQLSMGAGATAPVVSEDRLRAFQEANAAYRKAHDLAYQSQQHFNEEEKKREAAYAIVSAYQAQLAQDLQNHIDAMTLAQKQETMAKIFDAAVQERIAYGKTWTAYLAASEQYKFDKLAAEDELMRLAQTGKYDPNAPPPVPTKADLDLLSPIADLSKGPTKEDAALMQEIELSDGGLLNIVANSEIEDRELRQFPPAIVHEYNSKPAFRKQMQDEHGELFAARDAATQAATRDLEKEWDQKLGELRDHGLLQPGSSLTAQERANPQLHAQLQTIRQQLISEADFKTARAEWQTNDRWQAWIEAQNAKLTGKPAPIYVPAP